jgi:rhodanese-related sulfurtransferase
MKDIMHKAIDLDIEELNLGFVNTDAEDKHFADMKDHSTKDNILYLTECGIIKRDNDDLLHPEDKVTTEQFVTLIIRSSKGDIEPTSDDWSSGYIDYALYKGIIEDYDRTNRTSPIERRSAARIIHEALLTEFSERDEVDWSAAKKLIDLYSCHTCVMHIAQVYVKGIMFGRDDNVFDVRGNLTLSEAAAIVVRILDREKRIAPTEDRAFKSNLIHPDEAWKIMINDSNSMLIDVRMKEEYKQEHIDGSICIPLQDILNNPFSVSIRKDIPIILYCQKGYKSTLAAQLLIDAGYYNIYTIPGIEQYQYNLIK